MQIFSSAVLIILCGIFLYHLSQGAIFLPTHRASVSRMVELAGIKPGMKAVDLGSGDGRLVIALTQAGAQASGFEINPLLAWWSRFKIRQAGLKGQAKIYNQNFWSVDLGQYEVILVFGMSHIMGRLEQKLQRELRPHTLVVSNIFQFKILRQVNAQDGVYVYRI